MKHLRTTIAILTWICVAVLVVGCVVGFINGSYTNAVCNIIWIGIAFWQLHNIKANIDLQKEYDDLRRMFRDARNEIINLNSEYFDLRHSLANAEDALHGKVKDGMTLEAPENTIIEVIHNDRQKTVLINVKYINIKSE